MATTHKIRQVQLVGRKIRELRKSRKLTQTELSTRIGIQQSDLSRMENGEYRVSLDTLFSILGEFDIGIDEFFQESTRHRLSSRELQLVQDFNRLPAEVQLEVEALIARRREAKGELR